MIKATTCKLTSEAVKFSNLAPQAQNANFFGLSKLLMTAEQKPTTVSDQLLRNSTALNAATNK